MSLTAAEWRYAAQRAREGAPLPWGPTGGSNGPCVAISVAAGRGGIALEMISKIREENLGFSSKYLEFLTSGLPQYGEIYNEITVLLIAHRGSRDAAILLMERKAASLEEYDVPSTLPSEPELVMVEV